MDGSLGTFGMRCAFCLHASSSFSSFSYSTPQHMGHSRNQAVLLSVKFFCIWGSVLLCHCVLVCLFFFSPKGKTRSGISSEERKKSGPNHEEDAGHISEWHLASAWAEVGTWRSVKYPWLGNTPVEGLESGVEINSNPRAQLLMENIWELLGRAGLGETLSRTGERDGMDRQTAAGRDRMDRTG